MIRELDKMEQAQGFIFTPEQRQAYMLEVCISGL